MKWIAHASEANYWFGTYEKAKATRFAGMLHPRTIFYDLGANAGYYALIAARKCQSVYAFEPLPERITYLYRHLKLNSLANCTVVESAVGDTDGKVQFAVGPTRHEGQVRNDGTLTVVSGRLDTFCQTHPVPSLIKIDVEGAELAVLHGAARLLTEHHPAIFLATHRADLDRDCRAVLVEYGYQIEEIEPNELLAVRP
jgi:FkbM family methyltransferase